MVSTFHQQHGQHYPNSNKLSCKLHACTAQANGQGTSELSLKVKHLVQLDVHVWFRNDVSRYSVGVTTVGM